MIGAGETCDDANTAAGDGCDDACMEEPGYSCVGEPSVCSPVCGDGILTPPEGCDDGNTAGGDGCDAACAVENGYGCGGMPSVCAPICGDGMIIAPEMCDDGNGASGDGCSAACAVEPGYGCGGMPSVCVTTCGDGIAAGPESCDDGNLVGGDGCSAGCATELGYGCAGAPSMCSPTCGDGLVVGAEACDDGNSANGDGCSAACALEAGFTCVGAPSLCCVGEVEPNNASMSATGPVSPRSLACGGIGVVGDNDYFSFTLAIMSSVTLETFDGNGPGTCTSSVDTVIYLYGTDGTTLLASDDQAGINNCSKIDPTVQAGAANLPAGTYFVRVQDRNNDSVIPAYTLRIQSSACGDGVISGPELCDGGAGCNATCQPGLPGPGESLGTATPFLGCNIAPTSQKRIGAPSCFPPTGAVHWYTHPVNNGLLSVRGNAGGAVAIFNAGGTELNCTTNAAEAPIAAQFAAGSTAIIAVPTVTPTTCLSFQDTMYTGLSGMLTDLNITFPSDATGDYGMTTSATTIFLGTPDKVFAFPKTGNVTAEEHGLADGISAGHLGYELQFANGSLFSVDSTTNVASNRVFKIFDEPMATWGPTAWDLNPAYPIASPFYTVTFDGTSLLAATRNTADHVDFFAYSPAAPGVGVLLGTNTHVSYVVGFAADSQHFYVAGVGRNGKGLFRIDRNDITGIPAQIGLVNASTVHSSVVVDNTTSAANLYVRPLVGNIEAFVDPAGNAAYLGPVSTAGTGSDYAMTFDEAGGVIYLFETETSATGRVHQLQ